MTKKVDLFPKKEFENHSDSEQGNSISSDQDLSENEEELK